MKPFEVGMPGWLWPVTYLAETGLLLWVARWGGSSWLSLAATTRWFMVGVFEPAARFY